MQTILIPTDFKIQALDCVDSLCKNTDGELSLIYIHMVKLSDSITDLLMLSRRRREVETVSDAFYARCSALKTAYPNLKALRVEFFYGSTMSMFRNFLEANEVNAILNPSDCSISKLHTASVDPIALVNKCGLPIVDVVKTKPAAEVIEVIPVQAPVLEAEIAY